MNDFSFNSFYSLSHKDEKYLKEFVTAWTLVQDISEKTVKEILEEIRGFSPDYFIEYHLNRGVSTTLIAGLWYAKHQGTIDINIDDRIEIPFYNGVTLYAVILKVQDRIRYIILPTYVVNILEDIQKNEWKSLDKDISEEDSLHSTTILFSPNTNNKVMFVKQYLNYLGVRQLTDEEKIIIPFNKNIDFIDETVQRFSTANWFEKMKEKDIVIAGMGGIGRF